MSAGMSPLGMSARDRGHAGPPLPRPALLFCPADRPDRYAKALAAAGEQPRAAAMSALARA